MSGDELRLLTLHGLRLAGLASPQDVAAIHGLDPEPVAKELLRLQSDGLVAPVRGDAQRWKLTEPGRRQGEVMLAQQLDRSTTPAGASGRSAVAGVYRRFVDLNHRMLDACTRWQIVGRDPVVLNDHTDPDYDAAVIAGVAEIDRRIQPMCVELESVVARFGRYRPGFTEALDRLRRGETDWLTKPTILSYHTLWFQLHEDLLATLGLERAAEAARLTSDPDTERPLQTPGETPGIRTESPACRPYPARSSHQLTDIPLTDTPLTDTPLTDIGKDPS